MDETGEAHTECLYNGVSGVPVDWWSRDVLFGPGLSRDDETLTPSPKVPTVSTTLGEHRPVPTRDTLCHPPDGGPV